MRQSYDEATSQRARDAAIAAMGQRLAAAGLRARERRSVPAVGPVERPEAPALQPGRGPVLVADRREAFIRDVAPVVPPGPRRRAFTAIGRAAALASMASSGFAFVLLAQSPRWQSLNHATATKAVARADISTDQLSSPPESAKTAIPPAQLAEKTVASPAPLAAPAPAALPGAHVAPVTQPTPTAKPVASPPRAMPPMSAPRPNVATPRQSRPLQVQLAAFVRPRLVQQNPVQGVARHEGVRLALAHPAVPAHYVLPRWLTEARDTPARPIVMSPPPHDLEAPAESVATPPVQLASNAPWERPHSVLPPLPRPRLVYVYAGYAPPTPYP